MVTQPTLFKELSQITPASSPPSGADQVVGIRGGTSNTLWNFNQIKTLIPTGPTGLPGPQGLQGPPGIVSGVPDPLSLTQGIQVNAINPTIGNDPNERRAADIIATFNQLNSNIGFTDQIALNVQLNYESGVNIFSSGATAKYTPIALNVGGFYSAAGEKFVCALDGNFLSMGDSFLLSGHVIYAGGPIAGDEGQGYSPRFVLEQSNPVTHDTITAVVRTTYTATVTTDIVGSYIAQNLPVNTTAGANVGDWIILNQSIPSNNSTIWAAQILSINPGVSINCVCPINLNATTGHSITPALCLNLVGNAFNFGEGRTLINLSGTSYSTGTIAVPGAFIGTGTNWTNSMIGGNVLNVGAIYLNIDTLSTTPFSAGLPCRSVYQITTVNSTTNIGVFSTTVAADASYHGRGTGKSGLSYNIVPGARVLLVRPQGSPTYSVICETSTHTWNVGDTVECAICPFPDVHGWDYALAQFTAGGVRRYAIDLLNSGARSFDVGILFNNQPTYIGNQANPQYDGFSWTTAIQISSAQIPIQIFSATSPDGATFVAGPAIEIISPYGTGADSIIQWSGNLTASVGLNNSNVGVDFIMGNRGLLRSVDSSINTDGHQTQLIWQGYFQIAGFGVQQPYLRIGGNTTGGGSVNGTIDLVLGGDGVTANNMLTFVSNPTAGPPSINVFGVTAGGSGLFAGPIVPSSIPATSNTNQPSNPLILNASVWNGSAAVTRFGQVVVVPGAGTNAPVSMQLRLWDNVNNFANAPNVPLSFSSLGALTFGNDNLILGGDTRVTLDPGGLTAPRTVTVPNVAGGLGVVVAGSHTPASSSSAGTSGTIEVDGTYLYVCTATNNWVRAALTGGW